MRSPKGVIHQTSQYLLQKNGYGDLVVMSMETYENLVKAADVDMAIAMSEAEIKAGGELLDAKGALDIKRNKIGS